MAEKGGYKHFMQKEIFGAARAVRDTLLGRISRYGRSPRRDEIMSNSSRLRPSANCGVRNGWQPAWRASL